MQLQKHSHLEVSLLCVICDWDKRHKAMGVLGRHESFFNLITFGKGTASSKILAYLGLGETEKAVFISILGAGHSRQVLDELDQTLQLAQPGHGISFLAKVHLGCYHQPVEFFNDERTAMEQSAPHNLILVVCNRGYSEDVIEVARTAGAAGGTVVHARGVGAAGMEKFFGVAIAPEKDILMIVAQQESTCAIMDRIAASVGPATDARAVSFSLAVNAVRGLR